MGVNNLGAMFRETIHVFEHEDDHFHANYLGTVWELEGDYVARINRCTTTHDGSSTPDLLAATTRDPRRAVCARWGGAERPVPI